ncbi:MAG: hypothetical protein EA402_07140 [Planctomycetota bacterium]|nr:MAG: hypothetical protein EA402_07140 [Planctomycetota bacterium]
MPPQIITQVTQRRADNGLTVPPGSQRIGRADIIELLRSDVLFQVFTFDRLHWIEPLTCQRVDIGFDGQEAMIRWLQNHPRWVSAPRKSLRILHCLRWYYWIRETIMREPRLRYFDRINRCWLNPFSGTWQPSVSCGDNRLNRETLQAMAQVLVDCPVAARLRGAPEDSLLPRQGLDALLNGGDPMATAELPCYHRTATPPVAKPLSSGFARQDSGAFSTQDLSSLGRSLVVQPEDHPEAHRWHVVLEGSECAAVSWEHVCNLARRGRLEHKTLLRPEGGGQYIAAVRCRGLFRPPSTLIGRPVVARRNDENRSDSRALAAVLSQGNPQSGAPLQRWTVSVKPREQMIVSARDLRRLVHEGKITPVTMLRRDDMEHAVPASKVRGLFLA